MVFYKQSVCILYFYVIRQKTGGISIFEKRDMKEGEKVWQ